MNIKIPIQSLVLHSMLKSKTTSSQYVTGETNGGIVALTTYTLAQIVKSFDNKKLLINHNLPPNDKLLERKTWENGESKFP